MDDTVYFALGRVSGDNTAQGHQAVLSADGTRTTINSAGAPRVTEPAKFTWAKTGPNTGTLGLTGSPVVSRLEITFSSASRGTYRQFTDGGTTVVDGEIILAPLPRDPTPPLFNLSTRTTLVAGQPVTMGFVVDGEKPRRVLVRAVGPTLAQFGVTTPAANPTLTVFKNATQVGANAGWAGAPSLAAVFATVGAFALPANSRDCAIVLTLGPGAYTAQVRGEAGSEVLVEVYFVD